MSLYQILRGIIGDILQVGFSGPNLKNVSGKLEIKNAADSALENVSVATPTANAHAATKAYVDGVAGGTPQGTIKQMVIPVALTTLSSTLTLPNNSKVLETAVNILTAYDPGITIKVGKVGNTNYLQDTTDNNPQAVNLYSSGLQSKIITPASTIEVEVSVGATVGSAEVLVKFVEIPLV